MSLAVGLVLGVGLALIRDQMDHRLRSAEEVSQVLGLSVLGVVPHLSERKDYSETGRIVDIEPLSQLAEAYRTIRTAVYFGGANGEMKTLLITSPAPSDGKTTLCSNLAITMAHAGQKILVLDADFRRPSQHKIFQIDHEDIGLSTVLTGQHELNQAIRPSGIDGLDVLPCGAIPPNPSEMLNGRAFEDFLDELSERYDRILLDAPPVMPVADARILGAICDAALLVLRAEKSSRKPSQQAVEALLRTGTHILGAVVNDAPTQRGRYGYHNYGYYHYGYYQNDDKKQCKNTIGEDKRKKALTHSAA